MATKPEQELDSTSYGANAHGVGASVALVGVGAFVVSFIIPFFIDPSTPTSPAIGLDGLRWGGVLFATMGAAMRLTTVVDS
jgi:hypothetical protein